MKRVNLIDRFGNDLMINKAITTFGVSSSSLSFTTTSSYQSFIVPLNSIKCSSDTKDKFKLDSSNHAIKIGKDVNKIKINASIDINRGVTGYLHAYIKKNNVNEYISSANFTDWYPSSPCIGPVLLDVKEGDIIQFAFGVSGDSGKTFQAVYPDKSIYLTIEEI